MVDLPTALLASLLLKISGQSTGQETFNLRFTITTIDGDFHKNQSFKVIERDLYKNHCISRNLFQTLACYECEWYFPRRGIKIFCDHIMI
jgi:hypothetical protein